MSISSHLESLHSKHDQLKKDINYMYAHHLSEQQVAAMKKEKLKVKDEIHRFERMRKKA